MLETRNFLLGAALRALFKLYGECCTEKKKKNFPVDRSHDEIAHDECGTKVFVTAKQRALLDALSQALESLDEHNELKTEGKIVLIEWDAAISMYRIWASKSASRADAHRQKYRLRWVPYLPPHLREQKSATELLPPQALAWPELAKCKLGNLCSCCKTEQENVRLVRAPASQNQHLICCKCLQEQVKEIKGITYIDP